MADVRCPMCGKPNPADAALCRYCQARLLPLSAAGSPSASKPQPPATPASSSPGDTDWLRGLLDTSASSGDAVESNAEQAAEPANEGEEGDWLARIRQRKTEEQDQLSKIGTKPQPPGEKSDWPESPTSESASELAAWLASLRDSDESEPPATAQAPGKVEPPSRPKETTQPPRGGEKPPTPPGRIPTTGPSRPPEPEKEDDEWLRSLTARIQASQALDEELLKPRSIPPGQPPEPPSMGVKGSQPSAAEPDSAGDLPDWINELQPAEPGEPQPPAQATPAPQAGEPVDWLRDLSAAAEESTAAPGDIPDWMKELQTTSEEPAQPQASPAEDIPDWLQDFQEDQPQASAEPQEPTPAEIEPSSPVEVGLPDWESQPAPAAVEAEPPADTGGLPGAIQFEAQAVEPATEEEISEWLREFQSSQPPTSAPTPTGQPMEPVEAAAPVSADTTQPGAQEETPDWLKDLQATAPLDQGEVETPAPAEPAVETPIPDWMSNLSEVPAAIGQSPVEGEEGLPAIPEPPAIAEILPAAAELGAAAGEAETPEVQAPETPAGEIPDWLKEFESSPAEPTVAAGEVAAPSDSVREWLNSLNTAETPPPTPALEGTAEEELAPAEIPNWLQSIRDHPPVQPAQPVEPTEPLGTAASPFDQENLPDWMNEPQPAEAGWEAPEAQPAEKVPLASSEMSDLLASVSAEQGAAGEAGAEPLEPSQLPTWLQAMRPVEAAVSDIPATAAADDQRVEKSGPLAGLRGVLPGEEMVARYRKPPVYTNKLQVSEKQHLHAGLLEGILSEETQVQPLPAEPTQAPQVVTRLVVALLLIILALVPALTGFNLNIPLGLAQSQPGLAAAYQTINNLPGGANVLLAAEFEAGLSGELKAAALPVLQQLQSRQPKVVIASTVPVGPVLGEALLSQAKGSPLMNLGYLAGGTNALKMLAAHASAEEPAPLRQVVPFPYMRSWNDPSLRSLKDITSFQCIIVITDSLENARNWVEQVQPNLGKGTSLVMVSSAQVAPLVRTYLQNGQVQGLVSGLMGGTAFEQITRQPGLATRSWTAYQLTLAAMVLLIIAGALASGFSALFGRGKSKRKA